MTEPVITAESLVSFLICREIMRHNQQYSRVSLELFYDKTRPYTTARVIPRGTYAVTFTFSEDNAVSLRVRSTKLSVSNELMKLGKSAYEVVGPHSWTSYLDKAVGDFVPFFTTAHLPPISLVARVKPMNIFEMAANARMLGPR